MRIFGRCEMDSAAHPQQRAFQQKNLTQFAANVYENVISHLPAYRMCSVSCW